MERDSQGRPKMQWLISWKGYGAAHDEWRSVEDINTGGMELDAWREYEDMRRLKELTQPGDASHGLTVLDQICALQESVRQKVHEYLEEVPGCVTPWCQSEKPFRMLVLFSGTGSVEKAVTEVFPNAIAVSVDVDPQFTPTHCCTVRQWMELAGGMESYPPGFFDVIWASPPCTEYSRAKTTGKIVPHCLNPAQPHRDFVRADDNVRAAREVIQYLQPRYWFLENPVGHLAARPVMRDIEHLRHTCTYCKYGTQFKKATHIWTNAVLPSPLKQCTPQHPCSEVAAFGRHRFTAQSGDSKTQRGSGSAVAVYPIPSPLVQELVAERFLPPSEQGDVAVNLIQQIWEGHQLPSKFFDGDLSTLQAQLLCDGDGTLST